MDLDVPQDIPPYLDHGLRVSGIVEPSTETVTLLYRDRQDRPDASHERPLRAVGQGSAVQVVRDRMLLCRDPCRVEDQVPGQSQERIEGPIGQGLVQIPSSEHGPVPRRYREGAGVARTVAGRDVPLQGSPACIVANVPRPVVLGCRERQQEGCQNRYGCHGCDGTASHGAVIPWHDDKTDACALDASVNTASFPPLPASWLLTSFTSGSSWR